MNAIQLQESQLVTQAIDAYNRKDYGLADTLLRQILSKNPNQPDANHLHGLIAQLCGQLEPAKQLILRAIHAAPNVAQFHDSLGLVFIKLGEFHNAEAAFKNAIQLDNTFGQAFNNLAGLLQKVGKRSEAEKYYLKADELGQPWAYSNYLLMLNYMSDLKPDAVLKKHQKWEVDYLARHQVVPIKHRMVQKPKKLKVGYVSGDFKAHSVAYFFEPLLDAIDRTQFEIVSYYNDAVEDQVTERLKSKSDQWRGVVSLTDEQVVELIRQDEIDILVDLSGHSGFNRLGVFARKPAPVQITWLGYPNSTGLSAIDFRIVDNVTDPENTNHCAENLLRLEHGFLCYQGQDFPVSNEIPFNKKKFITFGSFNNLAKMNDELVACWSKILKRVPGSKLLLKSQQFMFKEVVEELLGKFATHHIESERLVLHSHTPTTEEHMKLYNDVDIALDTFPYNGTTTTCEALWMGVPVVAFLGDRHASRVSGSILHHAELDEMLAPSEDAYIELAVRFAHETQRLTDWRKSLRIQLIRSGITNKKRFAEEMAQAYQFAYDTIQSNQ